MSLLSGLKAAVSKVCTRSGEKVIHQAKSVLICPSTYTTVFAPLENTYNEGHTFPIFSAEKCWSMALLWYNQSIMYFSYNTLYFPPLRTDVVYPLHTCVILQCMWISYQIHTKNTSEGQKLFECLCSAKKRISNSIQRHFFLLYNFRENFTMQMRSLKKRSKRLLSFVTGLGLVLKLCPILSAFSQWCSKVHTTHATVSKLDYKNIVEDGSSWCTYWFPCQGKH